MILELECASVCEKEGNCASPWLTGLLEFEIAARLGSALAFGYWLLLSRRQVEFGFAVLYGLFYWKAIIYINPLNQDKWVPSSASRRLVKPELEGRSLVCEVERVLRKRERLPRVALDAPVGKMNVKLNSTSYIQWFLGLALQCDRYLFIRRKWG